MKAQSISSADPQRALATTSLSASMTFALQKAFGNFEKQNDPTPHTYNARLNFSTFASHHKEHFRASLRLANVKVRKKVVPLPFQN
jgi:hypothetical protein